MRGNSETEGKSLGEYESNVTRVYVKVIKQQSLKSFKKELSIFQAQTALEEVIVNERLLNVFFFTKII